MVGFLFGGEGGGGEGVVVVRGFLEEEEVGRVGIGVTSVKKSETGSDGATEDGRGRLRVGSTGGGLGGSALMKWRRDESV